MAGATIWKGSIHFGDTEVPVKLHTAVKEERVQFRLLHRPGRVRMRQKMVCAYEKQPVPAEEQSKGRSCSLNTRTRPKGPKWRYAFVSLPVEREAARGKWVFLQVH